MLCSLAQPRLMQPGPRACQGWQIPRFLSCSAVSPCGSFVGKLRLGFLAV